MMKLLCQQYDEGDICLKVCCACVVSCKYLLCFIRILDPFVFTLLIISQHQDIKFMYIKKEVYISLCCNMNLFYICSAWKEISLSSVCECRDKSMY